MGRQLCVLLVCVATLPLFCQTSSPKPQVGTITAVNVHRSIAQTHDSDALQYDVSLKVGNTIYMVLYTPPSSSKGVEYALGQNVIVLIGSKSITFTKFGKTFEVPILSREILPIKTGIDWSRQRSSDMSWRPCRMRCRSAWTTAGTCRNSSTRGKRSG